MIFLELLDILDLTLDLLKFMFYFKEQFRGLGYLQVFKLGCAPALTQEGCECVCVCISW